MTNTQQLVLESSASATATSGVGTAETPAQDQLETVQLTELRPVEHSRIRADDDPRHEAASDGLKLLRSFAAPKRHQLDELEFFGLKSSSGYQQRDKKRSRRWKHHVEQFDEPFPEDDDPKKLQASHFPRNGCHSDAESLDDEQDPYGENGDFEYLQDRAEDEVYEYCYRELRSSSPGFKKAKPPAKPCSDEEDEFDEDNDDDVLDKDYREEDDLDDDDDEDFVLGQRGSAKRPKPTKPLKVVSPIKRPRGRPRKHDKPPPKLTPLKKVSQETKEQTEKELQEKINDIIKKNYLMQSENNNIVEKGSKTIQEIRKEHEEIRKELQEIRKEHKEIRKEREKIQKEFGEDSSEVSEGSSNESPVPNNKGERKGPVGKYFKKHKCMLCQSCFKGSGGLRNHYKIAHATGPVYTCDDCGKEFPLKERLKLHVRTHTGYKPYKCSECGKTFARGGQLVQHRRTHTQLKPYSCELCPGTFTSGANLALHMKRHNGQKDHKCDICGRGFVRRDALKKHLECLHKDVKSFRCNICNKTFKGHLPQHMRTHVQDRPHGCATCGQRFAQKSQLTVHQRTHSGQRPFRCLVCWQAFAHSTALKLHTRRHTGERPFKCYECNAGFTQLPHWKKHMKCIHGRNEPYHCRKCNSFFRIKSELDTHNKEYHEDDHEDDGSSTGEAPDESMAALAAFTPSEQKATLTSKYQSMTIEKMRLLLAVLLKRISKQERLDELGFGKRLIDEVLIDSLLAADKEIVKATESITEFDALRANLNVFLEWTVPKEHWESFQEMNKTPEEILETLTDT